MKNKFPLVIAIVIGIAALFAIRQYVNKMQQQAADKLKGKLVVAAATDIPAGAELTAQMIGSIGVPQQFIPAQAILQEDSDQVKLLLGRNTKVAIKAGSIILWSDFANEAVGGLSSIIPTGRSAFAVSIGKGVNSALIQPSDHIDIIGSFAVPKPAQPLPTGTATWRQASDMVNVVLLQDVTVLAVGGAFGGSPKSQGESGGELTLSLTLPEAQELMFAEQNGELGAVLRRSGATDVVPRAELPRVTFEKLEEIIGDLDGQRNFHNVVVQKGSQSVTVPVNNNPTPAQGGQQ